MITKSNIISFAEIECDKCGEVERLSMCTGMIDTIASVTNDFRSIGWSIGKYNLCPRCKQKRGSLKIAPRKNNVEKHTTKQIIRCKDCKFGEPHNGNILCMKFYCDNGDEIHGNDWYCADGELK